MIPYEELVHALHEWRQRQGLPTSTPEYGSPTASSLASGFADAAVGGDYQSGDEDPAADVISQLDVVSVEGLPGDDAALSGSTFPAANEFPYGDVGASAVEAPAPPAFTPDQVGDSAYPSAIDAGSEFAAPALEEYEAASEPMYDRAATAANEGLPSAGGQADAVAIDLGDELAVPGLGLDDELDTAIESSLMGQESNGTPQAVDAAQQSGGYPPPPPPLQPLESYQSGGYPAAPQPTGTYQADGYQADGYQADGYQADGYQADGYPAAPQPTGTYQADGYQADGYQADGYPAAPQPGAAYQGEGYQPEGYQPEGYQPEGYQPEGYQPEGYQPEGYQPEGYQPEGYPADAYSPGNYQAGYPQNDGYGGHPQEPIYDGGQDFNNAFDNQPYGDQLDQIQPAEGQPYPEPGQPSYSDPQQYYGDQPPFAPHSGQPYPDPQQSPSAAPEIGFADDDTGEHRR